MLVFTRTDIYPRRGRLLARQFVTALCVCDCCGDDMYTMTEKSQRRAFGMSCERHRRHGSSEQREHSTPGRRRPQPCNHFRAILLRCIPFRAHSQRERPTGCRPANLPTSGEAPPALQRKSGEVARDSAKHVCATKRRSLCVIRSPQPKCEKRTQQSVGGTAQKRRIRRGLLL